MPFECAHTRHSAQWCTEPCLGWPPHACTVGLMLYTHPVWSLTIAEHWPWRQRYHLTYIVANICLRSRAEVQRLQGIWTGRRIQEWLNNPHKNFEIFGKISCYIYAYGKKPLNSGAGCIFSVGGRNQRGVYGLLHVFALNVGSMTSEMRNAWEIQ